MMTALFQHVTLIFTHLLSIQQKLDIALKVKCH